jgi:hypothetical protein
VNLVGVQPRRSGLGARFAAVLSGEVAVTLFHFLLNLQLIRELPAADYGVFAILFLSSAVLTAIGAAASSVPLTVHAPRARSRREAGLHEVVFGAAACAAAIAAGLLVAALAGVLGGSVLLAGGAASHVVAASLRAHLRAVHFARNDGRAAMASDVVYVAVGASLFLSVWLAQGAVTVATTFLVLAAAGLASCAVLARRMGPRRLSMRRSVLRRLARHRRELGWDSAQTVAASLHGQMIVVLVAAVAGSAAYAALHAGSVLLSPARTVSTAAGNTLRPEYARLVQAGRWADVLAQMRRANLAGLALMAAFGLALVLGWPLIHATLFARQFGAEPMALIVALNWLAAVLYLGRDNLEQALRADHDVEGLFAARLVGAGAGLVAIGACLLVAPPAWALLGVVAGEMICLAYVASRLARAARRDARPA